VGELTGEPVTVANPVSVDPGVNVAALSVSAMGLSRTGLAGQAVGNSPGFDRSGRHSGRWVPLTRMLFPFPGSPPDGHRVTVYRVVQGNADISPLDAVRSTRFTDPGLDRYGIRSPDGSRIVFDSNRKGHRDLY
jgi:hypothetical protein